MDYPVIKGRASAKPWEDEVEDTKKQTEDNTDDKIIQTAIHDIIV